MRGVAQCSTAGLSEPRLLGSRSQHLSKELCSLPRLPQQPTWLPWPQHGRPWPDHVGLAVLDMVGMVEVKEILHCRGEMTKALMWTALGAHSAYDQVK